MKAKERRIGLGGLRALDDVLTWCREEREEILSQPFTAELSRRLEAVDEIEGNVWDIAMGSAP